MGLSASPITAEDLYRDLHDRIFQIQVIDLVSNKKSSIGSGFLVSDSGHIATNYHVVADIIHAPEKYRIEYLDSQGRSGLLQLRAIDVIHDLAIVSGEVHSEEFLPLSPQPLSKGAHIYAIGNPHDLGMSIIEGTFNGLLDKSQYQKILFSGSLNPGMSGGPALDQRGRVIGVNVSTAGNDLSFLVPVGYLRQLVERMGRVDSDTDFGERIEQQILQNQQQYMQNILDASWKMVELGAARVPAELQEYFKCWGKTDNEEDRVYEHTYTACASPDSIYISSRFNTGNIDFRYDWYDAGQLNSFQFYTLYEQKFAGSYSTNSADKEDVTNYRCKTDFVDISGRPWKIALCFRNYRKFSSLYDISLTMAQIQHDDRGLLVNMNATGLGQDMALAFARKYMESIEWRD
jgi:hypothetical protein